MSKIVGIKFKEDGPVQHYDSGHFVLKKGDRVVINIPHGQAIGIVCTEPRRQDQDPSLKNLEKIFRLATPKDLEKYDKKCRVEKEVYVFCSDKIKERSLDMSLVGIDRFLDGSKITVFFCADERVDFRELVKDLVQRFHTRIEMKQIGVRHQAKMVGGLGTCGRQLCCSSFLNKFDPVSIRMAKEQNLSLNPTKISGMCGRLMCCLAYEYNFYSKEKKRIPKIGKKVTTTQGPGKVIRQNILREILTVQLESGEEIEISPEEIIKRQPDEEKSKE